MSRTPEEIELEHSLAEADALLRDDDLEQSSKLQQGMGKEGNRMADGSRRTEGGSLEDLEESEGLPAPATMAVNAVRPILPVQLPHSKTMLMCCGRCC